MDYDFAGRAGFPAKGEEPLKAANLAGNGHLNTYRTKCPRNSISM